VTTSSAKPALLQVFSCESRSHIAFLRKGEAGMKQKPLSVLSGFA
jgi:hypothetical protein